MRWSVCMVVALGLGLPVASEASPARLGFVPDAIANQLGNEQVVIAMDVEHVNLEPWLAMIPAQVGCVRDLVKSMRVAVIIGDPFVVYATGLAKPDVRRCLDAVASLDPGSMVTSEGPDGALELAMDKDRVEIVWRGDIATIHEAGAPLPPAGPPSAKLRALAAGIPADARAFLVATRFTLHPEVTSSVAWLRISGDTIITTLHADASEPGIARALLHDFVDGFKDAMVERHVHVNDSWFRESSSGTAATIEVHLPLAVVRGAH